MDAERVRQIWELFEAALELEPDTREEFLRKACGNDADLRSDVEKMLAAYDQGTGRLGEGIIAPNPMTFKVGAKLGTYEIVGHLGKGGMGEVYRARDSKPNSLKRDVAIKVLPENLAGDADRVARFHQEAQVLASLNHPHIGAIYDLVHLGDLQFLVLELVEGETLADRIARGPIPIDETLRIAKQIAEAVEAAHEKRIVHRDLKPANIKLTPDRTVKVLDFGLARMHESDEIGAPPPDDPTIVSDMGMILGTAQYMSPEQAQGQKAQRISDVWAFGCVLYEMLAGRPVFEGKTTADILAEILKSEPNWDRLPAKTPEGIRRLLRRCLVKDQRFRLHDIADARLEIEDAQKEPFKGDPAKPRAFGRREWILSTAGAAGTAVVGYLAGENAGHSNAALQGNDEILIGAYGSLTVDQQTFGISTRRGFEMARDLWNAANGIRGRRIRLIMEDDQGKPEFAAAAVKKLITEDHVIAVLGEFQTNLTLAGATVAQNLDVPMISHGSTAETVTQQGINIFRVCFVDTFQGWAIARYALKTLGIRKVVVLRDISLEYSKGLAKAFTDSFLGMGGETVETQDYRSKDNDFFDQLRSIRNSKPQAVFVPGYYEEVGLIARQALDLHLQLLGGDGWDSPKLLEKAGAALNGSYYSSHFSATVLKPEVQNFVGAYKHLHAEVPDAAAALAYDAANVLFEAIQRAPSTESAAIRDEIGKTKDYDGVTGKISLGADRNAKKAAVILHVKGDGKIEQVDTIDPV